GLPAMVLPSRSCRYDNPGGADHGLAETVAALVDLDHRAGLRALGRNLRHRLVQLGIEPLSLWGEALDARPRECGDHVVVHELDAGDQRGCRAIVLSGAVGTAC